MSLQQIMAGYVPGVEPGELSWHVLRFEGTQGALEVKVPELTPTQLQTIAQHVRQHRQATLATWSVSHIIRIIDAVIARLLDRQDPYRKELDRCLPIITGYDAEMVRLGLTTYLKTFRAPQLQRFVTEDFANPKLLDEFQPRPKGGMAKAFGPEVMAHVWAGNVPGLPLWSLISGLLVKAGSVGKVASAEPLTASIFAKLLVEVEPKLADCLAVVWWKGGDSPREQALFSQVDLVAAYGGNDVLAQIRQNVPITTRFLPYGHKLSFGMVGRRALDARKAMMSAKLAALDVARYDQQGCYSPQMFFVERGGKIAPQTFAQYLSAELANLEQRYPRRMLSLEDAASVASWRQGQEIKGFATEGMQLMSDSASPWAVSFSETATELVPCALNRSIQVMAVGHLRDAIPLMAPQRVFLQTVGVATEPSELFQLSELLGQVGVTRICALGAMTAPEAGWHHDGRFNLLDLVRMVEIEQSAENVAETLAPYQD